MSDVPAQVTAVLPGVPSLMLRSEQRRRIFSREVPLRKHAAEPNMSRGRERQKHPYRKHLFVGTRNEERYSSQISFTTTNRCVFPFTYSLSKHLLRIYPLSVFYCCARNDRKLTIIKQHKFIVAQFVSRTSGHGTTRFSAQGLTG